MEMNLKVFTLNCWGIPVISKDRRPRMEAIADELCKLKYDIVCLQEVWTDTDYNLIRNKAKDCLPYSHYFYSGVVGSGICILSKHPFQEVFYHQWPINGYVHKLQHGDWFGGKGIGLCRLKINDYNVNVYSAHLHAEYDRTCDEYLAHRVLQAFDTAQFIRLTAGGADVVILAGDLNTEPGDLPYEILTSACGLKDGYNEAEEKIGECQSTNESCFNSYTDAKLIQDEVQGKRIDYVMFHAAPGIKVSLSTYCNPLPDRVANSIYSYSDHEAIGSTFSICKTQTTLPDNNITTYKNILKQSMSICDNAIERLTYHRRLYWFLTTFLSFMLFVTIGMNAPYNFTKIFHILRFVLTGIACFTLIMATLWNRIEYNAVLAGKMNMEVSLKQIENCDKEKKKM